MALAERSRGLGPRGGVLDHVDVLDRARGQRPDLLHLDRLAEPVPARHPREAFRHAAERQHPAEAADGIGAAAEAEQEDPVARPVGAEQRRIAVDDVIGDAVAGRLGEHILEAPERPANLAFVRIGAEAGIVEADLPGAIRLARRHEQAIDIRPVDRVGAAGLPRPIREDADIARHGASQRPILPLDEAIRGCFGAGPCPKRRPLPRKCDAQWVAAPRAQPMMRRNRRSDVRRAYP